MTVGMRGSIRESGASSPALPGAILPRRERLGLPRTLVSASSVAGRPLACGHYLAEEVPAEVLAELLRFLA